MSADKQISILGVVYFSQNKSLVNLNWKHSDIKMPIFPIDISDLD